MKRYFNILIAAMCLTLGSCADKLADTNIDLNADVDIHSFSINGRQATIDNTTNTITLEIPGGADITSLVPVIEVAKGAVVTPASGAAQDFSLSKSKPVEYKVTNGSMYNIYKVTVTEIRPHITSFKVGNYDVLLDDEAKSIIVYTNGDLNISALMPIIEFTEGTTLSPASGTAVDFTNPVTYTLSYEGNNYVYTAKAITAPVITIYNGEDVNPVWAASFAPSINNDVANPQTMGINPSAHCVSVVHDGLSAEPGGKLDGKIPTIYAPKAYSHFSLKVKKDIAGPVRLELQFHNGDSWQGWQTVFADYTNVGEWQELIFPMPSDRTTAINYIFVSPHFATGNPAQTMYWDDLKLYPKGSLPLITSFSINGVAGVIDQTTKTITLDGSSLGDLTSLTPVIATNPADASVSPSGTVDFTNQPITYTVTSSEGVSVDYSVKLTGVPIVVYNGETVFATWWDIAAWDAVNNRTLMGVNIDNPQKDAVNSTDHCMSIPRTNLGNDQGGRLWSGGALWQEAGNKQIDFDPALYGSFKMMIKKSIAGPVSIEIQDNNSVDANRVKNFLSAEYTTPNQWQELTFDIPVSRTAQILNLLIRVHDTQNGLSAEPMTMYWDELKIMPR